MINFLFKKRIVQKKVFDRGFSMIELLLVIAIIAILAGLFLSNFGVSRVKSRNAQRMSDLNQLQLSIEQYYDDSTTYPTCNNSGVAVTFCNSTESASQTSSWNTMSISPNYQKFMPKDPTNQTGQYAYYYARGYRRTGTSLYQCVNQGGTSGCLVGNPSTDFVLAARLETYSGAPNLTNFTCPGPGVTATCNVLVGND